jgi:hypothetical protein
MLGLVYLFFGISGLQSGLVHTPPGRMRFFTQEMAGNWGFVYSWLPSNTIHNIVYILIGGGGVLSCIAFGLATRYCKGLFALSVMFTILGVLPFGISSVWGLMPLFSWNIMLHTVTATLTYYFGWIYPLDLGAAMTEQD